MATSPHRSRFPMVVISVVVLAFCLPLNALSTFVMVTLWRLCPDPLAAAVVGVVVAVILGYLSFRSDTVHLLSQLDVRDMSPAESPSVHRLRDRLAERIDLDPSTLKLVRSATPNAMVLGLMDRDVAVLGASLFRLLDAGEFGVLLVHELVHPERKDGLVRSLMTSVPRTVVGVGYLFVSSMTLLMTGVALGSAWMRDRSGSWAETLAGRVRLRLDEFVGLFDFGPTVFVRSQSRKREFVADTRAAEVTDKPVTLASVLRELEQTVRSQRGLSPLWVYGEAEVEDSVSDLLSTHPSTDERVERLATVTDESMTRIEIR